MTQVTPDQAAALAWSHLDNNRVGEAEHLFRQILAVNANHLGAVLGLTTIAAKIRHPDAEGMIQRLVAAAPNQAIVFFTVGNLRQGQGRLDDAIDAYRKAIALAPNYLHAYCNLGTILCAAGRVDESITVFRQAFSLHPTSVLLGLNLGNALWIANQRSEAIDVYRATSHIDPHNVECLGRLASALTETDQFAESTGYYQRCIEREPGVISHLINLASNLAKTGDTAGAVALCRRAITVQPNSPEGHSDLGMYLTLLGRSTESIEHFERSIAVRPEFAKGHFHLALASLLHEDYPRGWTEYEWRWRVPGFPGPVRPFTEPRWTGGETPAAAKTILVHAEQGLGDTFQFARFVPLVVERGWRVVLEVQPGLTRLFEMSGRLGADILCPRVNTDRAHLPPFDWHVPMASLPLVLNRPDPRQGDFPKPPYLRVTDELTQHWRSRVESSAPGFAQSFKVGLVWGGNPAHRTDVRYSMAARRSTTLAAFTPLAKCPATFFSLQKGLAAEEAKTPPPGMTLIDLTDGISDFADTAAIMNNLDLVICVDTAVAHLAGALGRRCWVLLPHVADWRWLIDRTDSPWYPSVKLFRQTRGGDWNQVLDRVADELEKELASQSLVVPS